MLEKLPFHEPLKERRAGGEILFHQTDGRGREQVRRAVQTQPVFERETDRIVVDSGNTQSD